MVCDFCTNPDAVWDFPARDFVAVAGVAGSEGGWAACPACHALIVRGDREKLARRCAKRLVLRNPGMLTLEQAMVSLRELQDRFWANRLGPPVPLQRVRG